MRSWEVTSLRQQSGVEIATLEAPSGAEWIVYQRGDGAWVDNLNRDGRLLLPDVQRQLNEILEAVQK